MWGGVSIGRHYMAGVSIVSDIPCRLVDIDISGSEKNKQGV